MEYFNYVIDSSAEKPIMLIDKHIGYDEDMGTGIDGGKFMQELLRLEAMGKKSVDIWINSIGGVVLDGQMIYSAILNTKMKVDTYCMGVCASIAAVIFQAGRTRYMSDFGSLMFHDPSGSNDRKISDTFKDMILTMVVSRCKVEREKMSEMMTATTWLMAEECIEYGLCDELIISSQLNKPRKQSDLVAMYKECNSYLSTIKPIVQMNELSKVANRLGLNEAAAVGSVLSEIDRIENSLKTEIADLKNQLSDANKAKNTALDELKTMKNKISEIERKETEARKEVAKQIVNDAVKLGKIENKEEVITTWTNKLVEDFDTTKSLIESIPAKSGSQNLKDVQNNASGVDGLPTSAASIMAEVRNKLKV